MGCTVFSSVAVVVKQGRMLGKYYLQFIDDLVVSLAEAQVAFAVRFAHGRYCVLDSTFLFVTCWMVTSAECSQSLPPCVISFRIRLYVCWLTWSVRPMLSIGCRYANMHVGLDRCEALGPECRLFVLQVSLLV